MDHRPQLAEQGRPTQLKVVGFGHQGDEGLLVAEQVAQVGEAVADVEDDGALVAEAFDGASLDRARVDS